MTAKRFLFLFHRWSGIVLCVLFACWFVSGIFMMYVEFPQLTPAERRAGVPPLDFSTARLTPAEAAARLSTQDFRIAGDPDRNHPSSVPTSGSPSYSEARLAMILTRPVYIFRVKGDAQSRAVFADTGAVLTGVDEPLARQVATNFAIRSGYSQDASQISLLGLDQTDQWTVSAAMNPYRPLYRFALHDPAGTELYVSSTTAEVVRDTRRTERIANYFAAVTHWIYPTILRRHVETWTWVIDLTSGAGALLAVTGLWIGVLRWRWRRPPGKPAIPYRGLMRWHYITGAVFGVLALTWVFSGLLSMNPGKLNPPRSPAKRQAEVYSGKTLTLADFDPPQFVTSDAASDAELLHYDGQPFYNVTYRDGTSRLVPAATSATHLPETTELLARAPALMPNTPITSSLVLRDYDNYYYSHRRESGGRPLPVIRVQFADPDRTWFYIDPRTGQVIERTTHFNRVYRWLYNGLHSWDFPWLWPYRPLWDITVIALSLGGVVLCVLGVVIGIRRLRFELRAGG